MIKKYVWIIGFIGAFVLTACSEHLVNDKNKLEEIQVKFNQRRDAFLHNRQIQLLDVFDGKLSLQEREALQYLYAYETLSDLSNYDSEHYLQQVRYALKARDTFSWGVSMSDDDFLHFVLAPRAGTENMDSARVVIFHELKDRVKDMGMKEAALEVNHWCHEKVTYTGTDGRTSAPLATIKNARGRCGEESVLTVTALRAVGIPARQIYTPRWVHQDDNHAWVEFWVDGKWYFMGACEPEADVNQGWFVEPTRRAILTATQTPGNYNARDIVYKCDNFTRLNQITNYATAKDIVVKVGDENKQPLENVDVAFMVVNYAELYGLATLKTNQDGLCKLKLGLGDVIVWVTKEDDFSFRKVSVAETDTLYIELNGPDLEERILDMDLVPPVKKEPLKVSMEGKELNKKRLAFEDSVRLAYECTFMDKEQAFKLAQNQNLDTTKLWQIVKKSRGNWQDIKTFIEQTPEGRKKWILPMLDAISEKDLRDGKVQILLSHMVHTRSYDGQCTEEEYTRFLLNPRIEKEQLSSYKSFLRPEFDPELWTQFKNNPATIERWILDNININKEENYIWVPSKPQGVFEMKTCDPGSAKLFFVAMCRTAGVLSRIDRITGITQYKTDEDWVNVYLGEPKPEEENEYGSIQLVRGEISDQKYLYNKQFTLAKFENGKYRTLNFDFKKELSEFPEKLDLAAGNYLLLTTEREKSGTLLARMTFFNVNKDEHKTVRVSLRKDTKPLESLGKFYLTSKFLLGNGQAEQILKCSLNKGAVVLWLDPDKEPSKHVLKDFEGLKQSFDALNLPFIIILPNDDRAKVFNPADYKLPLNSIIVTNDTMLKDFDVATQNKVENQLPVLTFLSATDDVLYLSSGYKIGAGDQLLKVLKKYHE